jgi:hypothetical protein
VDSEMEEDADISDFDEEDDTTAAGQHDLCRWAGVAECSRAFCFHVLNHNVVNQELRGWVLQAPGAQASGTAGRRGQGRALIPHTR